MRQIILASSSPRRKELLAMMGYEFDVQPADINEDLNPNLSLREAIEELSFRKAVKIAESNESALIIGSDTIVTIDGQILGKGKDYETCERMISTLSGRTHQVITAVTLICGNEKETFSVVTDVTFFPLDKDEIHRYALSGEGFDKAGAYAVQGYGARFVKEIHGDFYSVIGLPFSETYRRIQKYL